MARVTFTPHLQRHLDCPPSEADGPTVRAALEKVFARNRRLRDYVLDEHGRVRKHVAIFVDGQPIRDLATQADPVTPTSEIYVLQALSGG